MEHKLTPKLTFSFENVEEVPELNLDTKLDDASKLKSKKQIIVVKKKTPKTQQDVSTRLF